MPDKKIEIKKIKNSATIFYDYNKLLNGLINLKKECQELKDDNTKCYLPSEILLELLMLSRVMI